MQRVRWLSSPPMVIDSRSSHKCFALASQVGHLNFGHLAFFTILGRRGHFFATGDFIGHPFEIAILTRQLGQAAVFARRGTHPRTITEDLGIGKVTLELLESA